MLKTIPKTHVTVHILNKTQEFKLKKKSNFWKGVSLDSSRLFHERVSYRIKELFPNEHSRNLGTTSKNSSHPLPILTVSQTFLFKPDPF